MNRIQDLQADDWAVLGVVVIGRNEGPRLERCLRAVGAVPNLIYVDSGSSDNSLDIARAAGVRTLALSQEKPFSAARARNEGVAALRAARPALSYVQFIDGDCMLEPHWLPCAKDYLDEHADCAAVIGELREMYPDRSIYNLLCAMEWRCGPNDISHFDEFGGISFVRLLAFDQVGGFNPDVIAGEDSEMAVRMRLAGHRVAKLVQPMAQHDANMTHFSQFWTRAVRSGHAVAQRYDLNGRSAMRDCAKELRSLIVWGMLLPIVSVYVMVLHSALIGSIFLIGSASWQVWRIYCHRRSMGDKKRESFYYAVAIMLSKVAQAYGAAKYFVRRSSQDFRIIEYK